MDVYICEKPNQGRDLAAILGAKQRSDGYLHNGSNIVVTWAVGHLLELFAPDEYDAKYKSWNIDDLPILPNPFKENTKKQTYKQYKVIEGLVKKARTVYVATDYDREGEAIARSLLDRFRYRGPVKRVCLTALDDASIRKALKSMKSGDATLPLYHAAQARQRADWLVGMNISRLYSCLTRAAGYDGTIQIGRVLTPMVSIVVDREKQIANFKPVPFYDVTITANVQNGQFDAKWIVPELLSDESARCLDQNLANKVVTEVDNAQGRIIEAETKPGKEQAPLLFDLISLQQYGNSHWGYSAQQVLDAAQALYENHKASSYPRTDCKYLPDSQHDDVPATLEAVSSNDSVLGRLIKNADPNRKSRAFNDKKVTAHHGIIPTTAAVDISRLNEIERNLYDAICRRYIAQFYPDHEFLKSKIILDCQGHRFSAGGKTPTQAGWKVVVGNNDCPSETKQGEEDDDESNAALPLVQIGEPVHIHDTRILPKLTKAPPHYTESSLLAAMEHVAKFVDEPQFKKVLKDTAGIGTPATRASIIEKALKQGYLMRQKKAILATEKSFSLDRILPTAIKSPSMTAIWEQTLDAVAQGKVERDVFLKQIEAWISQTVNQLKDNRRTLTEKGGVINSAFQTAMPKTFPCFACQGDLKRIKGKNGFFWGCQSECCKKTFPDNRGKPEQRIEADDCPVCADCGKPMRLRQGRKTSKAKRSEKFWGCSGYPECKSTAPYKASRKTAA